MNTSTRRLFLARATGALGAGAALAACGTLGARRAPGEKNHPAESTRPAASPRPLFAISLAQWSLHTMLYAKELDNLDFPRFARERFGINAVEYVNAFFSKKGDGAYNRELLRRCEDAGVQSVLIMCDGEGNLGDPDGTKRTLAVENHRKWLDAARTLGCHSIRVNAASAGTFEEQQKLAADGLRALCGHADIMGLNVIVENHWGLSSHGDWLAGVMKLVGHQRAGTLPDFGNFDPKEYDRYQGVSDMMPYARGVSAKSYDFDQATGEETMIDYLRMLRIVLAAGYRGRVGIEYEGKNLSEVQGVLATKALLERLRDTLALTFT